MKYTFNYQPSAIDLWKLSMYGIYGSMVGTVNIIFTIAALILAVRFWENVGVSIKILLIMGVLLFTFIQPIAIYFRAKKQIRTIPLGMEIGFSDNRIYVRTSKEKFNLKWNHIKRIIKKPGMIIILTTTDYGYIITNKMLGSEKESFYKYAISKIKK